MKAPSSHVTPHRCLATACILLQKLTEVSHCLQHGQSFFNLQYLLESDLNHFIHPVSQDSPTDNSVPASLVYPQALNSHYAVGIPIYFSMLSHTLTTHHLFLPYRPFQLNACLQVFRDDTNYHIYATCQADHRLSTSELKSFRI
jgi:hypothetical protein